MATNVIQLPCADFSFEPIDFGGADILDKYRDNSVYLNIVQPLLEMTPARMKSKVAGMAALFSAEVPDLIGDLKSVAADMDALRQMCEAAAARLTAVHAKLV